MRIFYTSSDGQQFDFSTLKDAPNPRIARIKAADFHRWEYYAEGVGQQYGMAVSQYNRDPVEYEAQLYLYGSVEERETFLERFHNAIMRDITLNTPGRLTWGDWQIDCVVIASDTYPHETLPFTTVNDLRFYCPAPRWLQPETINIGQGTTRKTAYYASNKKFPTDYAIGWAYNAVPTQQQITIAHHIPSDFAMVIYGPVNNPRLTVSESKYGSQFGRYSHIYGIDYTIPAGMYAIIDSRKKTVVLSNGKNLFNYRYFEQSVFEKIPAGRLYIDRNEDFEARIIVYKESDEPRWKSLSQM